MKLLKNLYVKGSVTSGSPSVIYYDKETGISFEKNTLKKSWFPSLETSIDLVFIPLSSYVAEGRIGSESLTIYLDMLNIKIKIKSFELSSRIFGFRTAKMNIVNKTITQFKFSHVLVEKKDWKGYQFKIYDNKNGKWISFCGEDLEILLPDFSKLKKKQLKSSSILLCKNDKIYNGKIVRNQKVAYIQTIEKNEYNDKAHVVEVLDQNYNKMKVYAKHFKIL